LSVVCVSFARMIERRIRGLRADIEAAGASWTPVERVDAIAELEAGIAMLQAQANVEAVAFVDQRAAADRAAGVGSGLAGRGAPVEIAMARGVSRATVDYQLAFTRQLVTDHPRLLQECLNGHVSQAAARHIVHETEPLTSEQRRAIDPELADLACELTPGDARKAAARKVAATDPQAAEKRAKLARARKAVRAVMHGDATGTLSALLPAEQALACWQTLDHEARCRRGDGDERPLNELMCDLVVERVTGEAEAGDLNLEIAVVISASSLFGIDDQPAKLVGHRGGDYGVVPAGLARRLAASDSAWARRLVCDPADGRLISMDTKKRRFDGALRTFIIYRDGVSRRPYSSTAIYDVDHITRHVDDGPTSALNGHGLGVYDHHLRDLPGWRVDTDDAGHDVTWTTPTGHRYLSRPPPILGHGNSRTRRRRLPLIEAYAHPINAEYAAIHRPRRE
jgi:hypothetical protein